MQVNLIIIRTSAGSIVRPGTGFDSVQLDLSKLALGTYLVQIKSGNLELSGLMLK
ncbi:MAG: hypothetical protein GQ574_12825 [Crocinitomix sp.]|nr:hypothetical protein [Crocinitomix sp.]